MSIGMEELKRLREFAKLLEQDNIKAANELWNEDYKDLYYFYKYLVGMLVANYSSISEMNSIIKSFKEVNDAFKFADKSFETNSNDYWNYILKSTKECKYYDNVEAFANLDNIESILSYDPYDDEDEYYDELPDEVYCNNKNFEKGIGCIYLPETVNFCDASTEINSISISKISNSYNEKQYVVYININDSDIDENSIKRFTSQIVDLLQIDGIPSDKYEITFCSKEICTNTKILSKSEVFSIAGLNAINEYLERQLIQTSYKRRSLS